MKYTVVLTFVKKDGQLFWGDLLALEDKSENGFRCRFLLWLYFLIP